MITSMEMREAQLSLKFRKELILNNDNIIWRIIHQRIPSANKGRKNVLYQEGIIGFIEAILSFDEEKVNTVPHTHIYTCIRNRMRKVFIKSIKHGLTFSYKLLFYVHRHNGKRIEFLTKKSKWIGYSQIKSLKCLEPLKKEEQWSPHKDFDSMEKPVSSLSSNKRTVTIGDTLKSESKNPLQELEETEVIGMFQKYVEKKGTKRQKEIIGLKFDLEKGSEFTLRQIGSVVGCSHETANREISRIMNGFKSYHAKELV